MEKDPCAPYPRINDSRNDCEPAGFVVRGGRGSSDGERQRTHDRRKPPVFHLRTIHVVVKKKSGKFALARSLGRPLAPGTPRPYSARVKTRGFSVGAVIPF